jgi:hypothetical protein
MKIMHLIVSSIFIMIAKAKKSRIVFGGVTVFTGLAGTAFGGIVLDWLRKKYGKDDHDSVFYAFACCSLYTIIVIFY